MNQPPITTASLILIGYSFMSEAITKELSLSEARYHRKKYWIWQKKWFYWNKVVKHLLTWDGEFKKEKV